jgi:hypothetical protein
MSTITSPEPDRPRSPAKAGVQEPKASRGHEPEPGERRALGPGFRRGTAGPDPIAFKLRHLAPAALALAGWAAIMLAMPFLGPSGRQVAVVGDSAAAIRAISRAGGRIVEIRRGAVIARADPAALYRAGAWLVVEGRLAGGCDGAARAGA